LLHREVLLLRKGLFITLVAASLVVLAAAVTIGAIARDPGRGPAELSLSFKPFTTAELLQFKLEVDIPTCGKKLNSPKLTRIEQRTSDVRGLPLKNTVPFIECPEIAIRFQLMEEFNKEMPADEIDADEKLLVALGLFPPDKSLDKVLTDVYSEQIAGTYDTESKEITIVAGKSTGGVMDELTTSHEVTHALQDQNFGLDKAPLENEEYNGDNDLAVTSLVEGDAMLTMALYARDNVNASQLRELAGEETSSEQLDNSPLYLQKSLLFPYEEGFAFVQKLASGGEGAVDRALADPPLSTEQIIHPEKYIEARDNPRAVPVPDISASLGEGWKKINEDCMGEFDVNVWFEQFFPTRGKPDVGEGWGGNTVQYYQGPGKKYVMVNDSVWDSKGDADEFFTAYEKLLKARFGGKLKSAGLRMQNAYLYQADGVLYYCGINGDATLCLDAPDRATLDKALESFPGLPEAPKLGI
jgi:hypothetical protein